MTIKPRREVVPQVVDGVLFYQGGGPKRPYHVVGYVDRSWQKPYLEESDLKEIVKVVREHDGNGAVVVRGNGVLPGGVAVDRRADEFTLRVAIIQ